MKHENILLGGFIMPNLLSGEKSPYLLQHADNPIDWFPWGEEAFKKAKKENKLILLSIGYSTCFWCHKMAREVFSDEDTAKYLNEHFVSIKVDREERPDVDLVYMEAALCMTENVGWPLNIFLTPDKKPFFTGTYFPVEDNEEQISFISLIRRLNEGWKKNPNSILTTAETIYTHLTKTQEAKEVLKEGVLGDALWLLKSSFDNSFGGFGTAPKFPLAQQIFFLLRYWYLYRDEYALYMVEKTLDHILHGEIHDKKAGGFYRYATTKAWNEPHYEKMLYTNALMAMAYLEAYEVIRKDTYRETVEEVLHYILSKLASEDGAFYSAEDSEVSLDNEVFIDKKVSVSLNGIAMAAFAMAGKALDAEMYIDVAKNACDFILKHFYRNKKLIASYYMDKNVYQNAYAIDYAYFIWGLIELYQATYEENYLTIASEVMESFLERFWDEENEGVLYYSKFDEQLLINPKEIYDGAIPSVNSISAMNFIRLSRLLEKPEWNRLARDLFSNFAAEINHSPADYLFMLCAVLYDKSTKEIIVAEKETNILDKFKIEFKPFTLEIMTDNENSKWS